MTRLFNLAVAVLFSFAMLNIPAAETGVPAESAKGTSSRPNVVFIGIDDMNDWIGVFGGHPMAKTPNIDRLAGRGTTFLNAHCNAPICNPSRVSLLLGLRPSSTGFYGLEPWCRNVPALANKVSLPQHFRASGYRTLTCGKIWHGSPGGPAKQKAEFDVWGPYGGVGAKPAKKLIGDTPMGNNPLMDWGCFPHKDEEKGDHQITTWAVDQLDKLKTTPEQPFLLCVGYSLPHVPCYATQQWFDLYPDDDSILPKIEPNDRADTSRFSWFLHWRLPEPRLKWLKEHHQWRNLVRSYLACTSFVDAQVGRLVAALEAQQLMDNTLIVLWGDHGYHLGEKEISGKNSLWEPATRVPLIFAGPGVAKAGRCTKPAELLDMYPTLIDLCGLPQRPELEGHSLLPQLQQANAPRTFPAITTSNQNNHSVRSEFWRYIHYADGSEELYNLQSDPEEFNNVASVPENRDIIAEHKKYLPTTNLPPVPGNAVRLLTWDAETKTATWEGKPAKLDDPIPQE